MYTETVLLCSLIMQLKNVVVCQTGWMCNLRTSTFRGYR